MPETASVIVSHDRQDDRGCGARSSFRLLADTVLKGLTVLIDLPSIFVSGSRLGALTTSGNHQYLGLSHHNALAP